MKNLRTFLFGALFVAIAMVSTSDRWIMPFLHDKVLEKFASDFLKVELPEKTKKIDEIVRVGQQSGNGDHCDYLAAMMLETDMSKESAESYFESVYSGSEPLSFIWKNEMDDYASQENAVTSIHTLSNWIKENEGKNEADLIVYIYESGLTSSWDYRCR